MIKLMRIITTKKSSFLELIAHGPRTQSSVMAFMFSGHQHRLAAVNDLDAFIANPHENGLLVPTQLPLIQKVPLDGGKFLRIKPPHGRVLGNHVEAPDRIQHEQPHTGNIRPTCSEDWCRIQCIRYTYIHAYIHTYIHTFTHALHTYIHTYTHIHT